MAKKSGDIHPAILILFLALSVFSVWAFINQITKKQCATATPSDNMLSGHIYIILQSVWTDFNFQMFNQMKQDKNLWNCIKRNMKGNINKWLNTVTKYKTYKDQVDILNSEIDNLDDEISILRTQKKKENEQEVRRLVKQRNDLNDKLSTFNEDNASLVVEHTQTKVLVMASIDNCLVKNCCNKSGKIISKCKYLSLSEGLCST